MKNIVALPQTRLHELSMFDVGSNADHINQGLIASELANWLETHLDDLNGATHFTTSGYALDLLEQQDPELMDKLKASIEENNISLVGVPYYNTAFALLSPDNYNQQMKQEHDAYMNYFGKGFDAIYTGAQAIPKHLSQTIGNSGMKFVGAHSLDIPAVALGSTQTVEAKGEVVGEHSSYAHDIASSELKTHISNELIALEPYVQDDERFNQTWQLLSSVSIMNNLEPGPETRAYDIFHASMNIMNDMAHTIRNIELTKQGKFEVHPEIVEHPSSRIQEVMHDGD